MCVRARGGGGVVARELSDQGRLLFLRPPNRGNVTPKTSLIVTSVHAVFGVHALAVCAGSSIRGFQNAPGDKNKDDVK